MILAQGQLAYNVHSNFAAAAEIYAHLIQLQPRNAEAYQLLGVVQRRLGKWPESLASIRRALELEPRFAQGWVDLMITAGFGRRGDEATAAVRRVAEIEPSVLQSGRVAISVAGRGHSTDELRAWLEKLPSEAGDSEELGRLRVSAAMLLGDYDELIRRVPSDAGPLALVVASAMAVKGDLPAARARLGPRLAELRQQLATDPEFPGYWAELGQIEAVLGHTDEAMRCLQKAAELAPEARDPIEASRLGRHAEATAAAEKYLAEGGLIGPASAVFARAGDRIRAEQLLRQARTERAQRQTAPTLMILGRRDEAFSALAKTEVSGIAAVLYNELYDPIRRDPRFIKILSDLGVLEAHARAQAWRAANQTPEDRGRTTERNGTAK